MLYISHFIYLVFLNCYYFAAWIASFFNPKAKLWFEGRKVTFQKLGNFSTTKKGKKIWFHCSSLGEFEQARPLIELFLSEEKETIIILTFYSPSGYEIRQNYAQADLVLYLPFDFKKNVDAFVEMLRPDEVYWIKYDFWSNMISAIHKRKTPLTLISSTFRKNQVFFSFWGNFFKEILRNFDAIFVQDLKSKELLLSIGIASDIAGDTRFDQVYKVAKNAQSIDIIEDFLNSKKGFVIGSAWQNDLIQFKQSDFYTICGNQKIVIAPHNVNKNEIQFIEKLFEGKTICMSKYKAESNKSILVIDNIGLLSSIYQYAEIAFIGGGFGKSVHNILEAAVYGVPTLFGPNFSKSNEAIDLISEGGAFSFTSSNELNDILSFLKKIDNYKVASDVSKKYVLNRIGATHSIYKRRSI